MKTFNTAGPAKSNKHYNIPPLSRWDADGIHRLIAEERYFVLHAPRQTGKTSCLLALMAKLNAEADYTALYVNLEPAQAARGNLEAGMRIILDALVASADEYLADRFLPEIAREILTTQAAGSLLREGLRRWCRGLEKPLVLFLDEVDSLVGDTLISIKPKSLRLGNFSHQDVAILYTQHTEKTGQAFEAGVIDYVFEQTGGQPWLVNAVGYEACFEMETGRDRTHPITWPMPANGSSSGGIPISTS